MVAEEPLFPRPLHFVRSVVGIDGNATTIHEYCAGNQIVTVGEGFVASADYSKDELLEIDHRAGTYSITPFTDLARVVTRDHPRGRTWTRADAHAQTAGAVVLDNGEQQVEIRPHPAVTVSRAALDVLLGAAWPNEVPSGHELTVDALRGAREPRRLQPAADAARADVYAVPAERTVTTKVGPDVVRWSARIVGVDDARVPAEMLVIPPGARLIESPRVRAHRELQELDAPHER